MEEHNESDILICGDFNVTLNHAIDNDQYAAERNKRARTDINNIIEQQEMSDVYRVIHGDQREYTWFCEGGNQKARLDYYLATNRWSWYWIFDKFQLAWEYGNIKMPI